jgi:hypothetical protein
MKIKYAVEFVDGSKLEFERVSYLEHGVSCYDGNDSIFFPTWRVHSIRRIR